ncbi:MAG: GMC family oxidoreductase N-terminal domain-containing protein, partial [Myxococcota bacterium]
MILDLRELADGSRLEADLCIVGSGPAGITIARRFAHGARRVVVLESGGLEPEREAQELNRGEVRGERYFDLRLPRQRAFGGTSAHWNGAMGQLGAADFAPRPWLAAPGWPIDLEEVTAHYPEALEICGGGAWPRERSRDARTFTRDPMPPGGASWLEVRHRQQSTSGPRRFGRHFRRPLAASRAVRVVLHANVTELLAAPGGEHVEAVAVRTVEGRRATVSARAFVLACGGLENPRLLLLSDGVVAGGLGNRHDQVGRCFQEHPITSLGEYFGVGAQLSALSTLSGSPRLLRDLCPEGGFAVDERCLQFGVELAPRQEPRWRPERATPHGEPPFV